MAWWRNQNNLQINIDSHVNDKYDVCNSKKSTLGIVG